VLFCNFCWLKTTLQTLCICPEQNALVPLTTHQSSKKLAKQKDLLELACTVGDFPFDREVLLTHPAFVFQKDFELVPCGNVLAYELSVVPDIRVGFHWLLLPRIYLTYSV
jgi:hypothetical protein